MSNMSWCLGMMPKMSRWSDEACQKCRGVLTRRAKYVAVYWRDVSNMSRCTDEMRQICRGVMSNMSRCTEMSAKCVAVVCVRCQMCRGRSPRHTETSIVALISHAWDLNIGIKNRYYWSWCFIGKDSDSFAKNHAFSLIQLPRTFVSSISKSR